MSPTEAAAGDSCRDGDCQDAGGELQDSQVWVPVHKAGPKNQGSSGDH